jgi:ABC-type glutathione transport system ATPase component
VLFEPPRQSEFGQSEEILSKKAPYLRDANFTWTKSGDGSITPGRRNFCLQIEGELAFKEGKVNLICGPTGSGKTSLLMALLGASVSIVWLLFSTLSGEMYFNPSGPSSVCHLPREDGVAYAAQESWVLNDTIRVRHFISRVS